MTPARRPVVLVVDDDPGARQSLEALLDEEFEVICVASVGQAKEALAREHIDVVVSDHHMPGQRKGLDFLQASRERHPGIVGILVTGQVRAPEIVEACRNWRDLAVLLKPYDPQVLVQTVRSSANIARLRQATQRLSGRTRGD